MEGVLRGELKDMPRYVHWGRCMMEQIPQKEVERKFGREALEEGCGAAEY